MGGIKKWQYKTTKAAGWTDSGISVFLVAGIVTPDASLEVIRDNADWMKTTRSVGQVVRYDTCAMAIDAKSLLVSAKLVAATNRSLETPTALLVHPDQYELFSTYADLMAESGILRSVFLDLNEALGWAREMAPIYVELRASEQRARALACESVPRTSTASSSHPRADLEESRRVAAAFRRPR